MLAEGELTPEDAPLTRSFRDVSHAATCVRILQYLTSVLGASMGSDVVNRACPNAQRAMFGKLGKSNVVLHGFPRLKRGYAPKTRRAIGCRG